MPNNQTLPSTFPIDFVVISCTTASGPNTLKGVGTITFWVEVTTRDTAICICTRFVSCTQEDALPRSKIFADAIQLALRDGSIGVYIDDDQNVASFDAIPTPPEPVPGLSLPTHVQLPFYDANTFVQLDVYKFHSRRVKVIELDGQLLVMKQISKYRNVRNLQEELDNYFQAQDSPYILPLQGIVRSPRRYVEPETMRIRTQDRVTGFLLPFLGVLSTWLIGGEWSVEEKESLGVTLLDGVLDLERRGVHLSDLKRDNILLALDGLKIIDLSSTSYTHGYNDRHAFITEASAGATPYGLGRVFAELFLEKHPSYLGKTYIASSTPTPFVDIIKRCCTGHSQEFCSVEHLWYATAPLLDPIRQQAHTKGITLSGLVNARWLRIQNDARSWEESHLGQTRNEYGHLTWWLPHFARESHKRWFVTPECYEAELWSDKEPITDTQDEEVPATTKLLACICSQDHHCGANGERLKAYWIASAQETAICVCTPLLRCYKRLPDSKIFHLAVETAIKHGFVGVYIADDNTISQYDTFPAPPPPRPAKASLKVPDNLKLQIMDEDDGRFLYRDLLIFHGQTLRLVELNGVRLVYKYFDKDPRDLQDELDHYVRLHSSPHVLRLEGLVRVNEYHIDPKTFRIESSSRISGFLLPFAGAWSRWWIGGEWIVREKEFLAVKLLDAVLDIERSGVQLTNLTRDNILLTARGLKVIGLVTRFDQLSETPAAETVFALGKAFAELFLERHPSVGPCTYIAAKTPPLFVDIIKRCCANRLARYQSVEDLHGDLSDSLGEIRSRTMSIAGLAREQGYRIRNSIPQDGRIELGQTMGPEPQPWMPSWAEDVLRYWEPPESNEAELWFDEKRLDG